MQNMSDFELRMMMKTQLDITKQCYADCVNNFSSNELSTNEKKCLQNCGMRLASSMMVMSEVQQGLMSRQGGMGQF